MISEESEPCTDWDLTQKSTPLSTLPNRVCEIIHRVKWTMETKRGTKRKTQLACDVLLNTIYVHGINRVWECGSTVGRGTGYSVHANRGPWFEYRPGQQSLPSPSLVLMPTVAELLGNNRILDFHELPAIV